MILICFQYIDGILQYGKLISTIVLVTHIQKAIRKCESIDQERI